MVSDRCGTGARLDSTERAVLTALPEPVAPMVESLSCELAVGHDGAHVAHALSAGGDARSWWLRWTAQARQLVELELCEVDDTSTPPVDCCLLPLDHPGPHSYDVAARPPRRAPAPGGPARARRRRRRARPI